MEKQGIDKFMIRKKGCGDINYKNLIERFYENGFHYISSHKNSFMYEFRFMYLHQNPDNSFQKIYCIFVIYYNPEPDKIMYINKTKTKK